MAFFVLGINHRTAPLHVRERVVFHPEELRRVLADLTGDAGVHEAGILSTCNRTEIYCQAELPQTIGQWMAADRRVPYCDIEPYLYVHAESEAVRHAFRVASGLDSMVIGEPQILGQLKEAVRAAREERTLGVVLDKLFQHAFAVAKDVRSTTAIGASVVSMAAATVRLAERVFERIADRRVLFIGAGEMIELCAAHFAARQPQRIVVANRTLDRGRSLADRFGATAVRLEELAGRLHEFDIIVTCTASQLPILGLGMVERALKLRGRAPMFIADLAVPRDVEAEVVDLDKVYLYTVDDLAHIVEEGKESRQAAVANAEMIVSARTELFINWLDVRANVPAIRALRDNAERMRRRELERALKTLARGGDPVAALDALSQRLTNKLLHEPTQALHRTDGERGEVRSLIARLYRLPVE